MIQYSLSELSELIATVLQPLHEQTFWVKAELAALTTRNGHGYFELVEKASNGTFAAKCRATCWKQDYVPIAMKFEQQTGKTLATGMQILVEVTISYHPIYGLSLTIYDIDSRYTLGDFAKQRQETIFRLEQEGLIDLQQQLTLPTVVQRLAIISSAEAAGYGDFRHQLSESPYLFYTHLFPAIMQGDKSEQSILRALEEIHKEVDEYDVIIIIRGGGSTTDLNSFDGYELSAACSRSRIPILSGIGHTRDISILDMVAYMPLKTPTAVAAFLIERMATQEEKVKLLRLRLNQVAERQILNRRHKIEMLRQRLVQCSPERIYKMGYSLATVDGKIVRSVEQLHAGQTIHTHFMDGDIVSEVQ